jgi:hypothetical protein
VSSWRISPKVLRGILEDSRVVSEDWREREDGGVTGDHGDNTSECGPAIDDFNRCLEILACVHFFGGDMSREGGGRICHAWSDYETSE